MTHFRSNVKFIIWSGFGAIIVLMLALSSILVYKLIQQSEQFNNVVKINNVKVGLVHTMRDLIRLRSLSLNKMALSDDIFYRDDEQILFNTFANQFLRTFDKFKKFNINNAELKLTKAVQDKVNIAYPLNQKSLERLLNDDDIADVQPVIVAALAAQENILSVLNELILLQQSYAEVSVQTTNENMEDSLTLLMIVVSIAIIFSIFVSQAVSKFVSLTNKELLKATETKSMFLANMSHEIRTPLTAIIGFAKSQMIPNLPAGHNERATKIILRNSEHLLAVINDILDFTKIEAHKIEIENTEFSLFNLIDDLQASLAGVIGDKQLKFNINYNYPIPDKIKTDKIRLRQILINLGGNAVKFTEQGFVNINIRYDRLENEIYFDINDSGIGMTHEQQEMVFQTFNQADITTTRKYGGTGLGLTISSQLIKKLGGELTVISEPGVGSTFSFKIANNMSGLDNTIKLINQAPAIIGATPDHMKSEDTYLTQGTILLVEDMPDNQELISFYLRDMGATVTCVNNGKEAVEISSKNIFDLILMDMQMPVMGGLEAVHIIRERGDKYPIVMLTANVAREYKDQSLTAGCNDFLLKPLNEQALRKIVTKYLGKNETNNITASLKDECKIKDFDGNPDIIISSLIEKDPDKYNNFITKFINHLPTYVENISGSIKIKNDKELKEIIHKLKGLSGNMGFIDLSKISTNIEIAIKQANRKEITRQFDELKATAEKIYRGNEETKNNKSA